MDNSDDRRNKRPHGEDEDRPKKHKPDPYDDYAPTSPERRPKYEYNIHSRHDAQTPHPVDSPMFITPPDVVRNITAEDFAYLPSKVGKEDFEFLRVLGTGAFAKVFLVRRKGGANKGKLFAMKVLRKAAIVHDQKMVVHTKAERHILAEVNHPFIVSLRYAFQTEGKLYLVLDYKNGGELFHHLNERMAKARTFTEAEVKAYAAELCLALEHLHTLGIIYRDLKLENVLLDKDGHLALTDFGLSKEFVSETGRTSSFAGTVEYMAPEMVLNRPYGKEVDWWALGVLIFELLTGHAPFNHADGHNNSTSQIMERIKGRDVRYPSSFSADLVSLLRGLLEKTPERRLGAGPRDAEPIKAHPWFCEISWEVAAKGGLTPPIRPVVQSETDVGNFDHTFTSQRPVDSPALPVPGNKDIFRGYSYVGAHTPTDIPVAAPAAPLQIPANSEFLRKYELFSGKDGLLGRGTFSSCYRCKQRATGQLHAVKVIETQRRSADMEVDILLRCRGQAHIVQLIEVCHDSRYTYLVLELCAGGELFERIKRDVRFTEGQAMALMHGLVGAVAYLHTHSIAHRDLKPENLLFTSTREDASLKIVDFGFAKYKEVDKPLTTPCYTLQYVAPEVLERDPQYDMSCDLWSLGVIMYTVLCGYPPFGGKTLNTLFEHLDRLPIEFPQQEWGSISDDAKDLVRSLLTVDPKRRITAKEMLNHPWFQKRQPTGTNMLPSPSVILEGQGALASVKTNIEAFHKLRPAFTLTKVDQSPLMRRRLHQKSTESRASTHSTASDDEGGFPTGFAASLALGALAQVDSTPMHRNNHEHQHPPR